MSDIRSAFGGYPVHEVKPGSELAGEKVKACSLSVCIYLSYLACFWHWAASCFIQIPLVDAKQHNLYFVCWNA